MEPFEFQFSDDEPQTVRSAVFQAIGAASMCWSETPQGVFDDERAREIGEKLLTLIAEEAYA